MCVCAFPSVALYDDRSIRAHVHRTRDLLSLSTLHSSLSTTLALQHDTGRNTANTKAGLYLFQDIVLFSFI